MLDRLRTDFQLSVMTMLGACAMLGITPFAVYRFLTQEYKVGVTDLCILLAVISTVGYAWLSGDTRRSGFALAILINIGGTAVSLLLGDRGLFWLFPCFVTTFFLTTALRAILINILPLLALVFTGTAFYSIQEQWSFVATSLVVSACAYLFALRNQSQRNILERLATHDPLTNAGNRRAMEEELMSAIATRQRNGLGYALIIFDLDHFKTVNDRFGHGVGDQVLASCAEVIRRHTRVVDALFRFGGEEFVLLMPGLGLDDVDAVAEKLRHKLSQELRTPAGPGAVTASFGAAVLHDNETLDQWLRRADQALYRAKAEGRNRVVVAGARVSTGLAEASSMLP